MGKKHDHSPKKVAVIKVLLDQKQHSQREIAKRLQISQKSVNCVSQAVKNGHGYSPARVGTCGRKTKLSPRTQCKLVQIARNNRRATSQDLKKSLEKYGVMFVLPQFTESSLVQDYEHVAHGRKPKLLLLFMQGTNLLNYLV